MKEYKTLRVYKETYKILKQKALDEETTVIRLLDKIIKRYYENNI